MKIRALYDNEKLHKWRDVYRIFNKEVTLTISLQTKWVLICFMLSTNSQLPRDKRSTSFGGFLGNRCRLTKTEF